MKSFLTACQRFKTASIIGKLLSLAKLTTTELVTSRVESVIKIHDSGIATISRQLSGSYLH